jgi:hypothetical protein
MISFAKEPFRTLIGIRALILFLALGLGIVIYGTERFQVVHIGIILFAIIWLAWAILFVIKNLEKK